MSTITPFSFEAHAVRVITQDAQPWFVLSDVCDVLDLGSPHKTAERLDEDEKGRTTIPTPGGPQEMSIINESGLYNLIFTSRKPEARRFRKWVTDEVLPAIRKTGSYALSTDKTEWFNRFARVLCLWDTAGKAVANKEWQATGLPFPMPSKGALRALMSACMDLPDGIQADEDGRALTARHNSVFGGRPRKGETPEQARMRRFHMVEKEIHPSEDGQNCTVITYSTQPEQ